jgi:hypothetical protein
LSTLDPSNDDDVVVIRAVARFLLTEQKGSPPTVLAIDTSAQVLSAMMRTGRLTMVVQIGLDIDTGEPGEWLHIRVPEGGMDAYIQLGQLLLPPDRRAARAPTS